MDTTDIEIKMEIAAEAENTQTTVQEQQSIKEEPIDVADIWERFTDFKFHTEIDIKDEELSSDGIVELQGSGETVCDTCGVWLKDNRELPLPPQSKVCASCVNNCEEALARAFAIRPCEVTVHRLVLPTDFQNSLKYSLAEQFYCYICNRNVLRRSHQTTHPTETSFKCSDCFTSFVCEKLLREHKCINKKVRHDRANAAERPFSCNECHKSFTKKFELVRHTRTHTGERPFSCDVCQKSFSQKCSLVNHIRIHTGERPFSCYVCAKSFSVKSHLVDHTRVHTGKRPFCCDVCKKSFSRKFDLVRHTHTHTEERPFSCDMCKKSFSQKSNLVCHTRTHTEERPFSCDVCHKSFSQKSHLVRHTRLHTGERRFCCRECGKGFTTKQGIKYHMKTHKR